MLNIITDPNPLLHKKTSLTTKTDLAIDSFVKDMYLAMKKANGIGLAAPQVGVSKQVAIIEINSEEKDIEPVPLTVFINPKIIQASTRIVSQFEGCLSLPGIEVKVSRPDWVTVSFLDKNFETQKITAHNLFARAIQHEIDHLNGILITDHGQAQPIKKDEVN